MLKQWIGRIALDGAIRGNRAETITVSALFVVLAVAITALVIYGAYFGLITALILRSAFFSLAACAGLLWCGLKTRPLPLAIMLYVLAILVLLPGYHLQQSYLDIIMRGAMATPPDLWLFVILMAAILILTRLTLGWALVFLVLAALAYAWFGDLIPGKYGHGGYDLRRLTSTLMLSTEGIYGLPMGVAVEYIFLFALFGGVLMRIGAGEVFVDIARGLTGRVQGGPGLSAALSSALLGTINGSAVANVVTTGTFTIPLMKRAGYTPRLAGAIEAAASSAGQILPPVMGAAAFLMAEILGVPYGQIALAALVPGLLYVLALMIAVRLEAGRLDLQRDPGAGLALLVGTLTKRGYLLAPLVGLIALLVIGFTPTRAAVICIVIALALSPWRKETRIGITDLLLICRDTLTATLPIIVAVAAAGVIIGVLNLTGLALMMSGMILEAGEGNIWLILVLTAVASFILGMGLPTSAAYLLLAVLVAPALTRLGVEPIVGHMFIFYYGLVSAITPPVALAAYAAASISGAGANETAVEAIRLGFVKLLAPFLFVTMPGLLMIGGTVEITASIVLAVAGLSALTIAFAGWINRPMAGWERLALTMGGLAALWPVPVADVSPATLLVRAAGLIVGGYVVWRCVTSPGRPGRTPVHP
ncbi:C4-dicarboxylate ABC transporter permease [Zhengella mangrovi]|uniref:C4-dicarboxylate ABC transporter permease n=1 Tax=Zhengella mangrovi TaxID=1982044 RepID=A0A2G1QPS7_9HYPH|nr:TRAP transporter fused permease subunit [Zhengella mangrovi]PHP67495.1 C4-dicarboxylate ABC transporter permease [Zhengella mangrovi]